MTMQMPASLAVGKTWWLPKADDIGPEYTSQVHLEEGLFGHLVLVLHVTEDTRIATFAALTSCRGRKWQELPVQRRENLIRIYPRPANYDGLVIRFANGQLKKVTYMRSDRLFKFPFDALDTPRGSVGQLVLDQMSLTSLQKMIYRYLPEPDVAPPQYSDLPPLYGVPVVSATNDDSSIFSSSDGTQTPYTRWLDSITTRPLLSPPTSSPVSPTGVQGIERATLRRLIKASLIMTLIFSGILALGLLIAAGGWDYVLAVGLWLMTFRDSFWQFFRSILAGIWHLLGWLIRTFCDSMDSHLNWSIFTSVQGW